MACGGIDLGQHWLRYWFVAWCHQAITWTNADFSWLRFCGIPLRAMLQQVPKLSFCTMLLKIIFKKKNTTTSVRNQWVKIYFYPYQYHMSDNFHCIFFGLQQHVFVRSCSFLLLVPWHSTCFISWSPVVTLFWSRNLWHTPPKLL